MRLKLTDVAVRQLKPTPKQTKVWDAHMPGFGLRVNGSSKSWIVMFGADRRLKTLGRYPDMTLKEARKAALAFLETPSSPTSFQETVTQYLDTYSEQHHSARTGREVQRLLHKHFLPRLGRKPLADVTTNDIVAITDGLLATPSEASHAFRSVRTMMRWAARRRMIPSNPLADVPPPAADRVRDRILADTELKSLWEVRTGVFGDIWAMLLLTGQRRSQISNLRFSWLSDGVIHFPAEIMKGRRAHSVPIPQMALDIINGQPRIGDIVFPGRRSDAAWNSWSNAKSRLDKTAGVADYVLHDLRRTYATLMQRIYVRLEVIEKLLAHQSGSFAGIVGTYQRHAYLDEMAMAVRNYDAYLRTMLEGTCNG